MKRFAGATCLFGCLFLGIDLRQTIEQEPSPQEFKLRAKRTEHHATAWCVAFSPDGKVLASGSSDRTVKLWDTTTAKVLATLDKHTGGIGALSFSPDGKTLVAGGGYFDRERQKYLSGDLTLWDVAGRSRKDTFGGHPDLISGLDFGPDGKLVATTGQDHSVRLWDVEGKGLKLRHVVYQGAVIVRREVRGDTARAVAFSPDGTLLAGGGENFAVVLWDVPSGREKARMQGHAGGIYALAYSPDGKMVASAAMNWSNGGSDVRLWDVTAGKEICTLDTGRSGFMSVAFSRDSKLLVVGENGGTVKVWDVATRKDSTILFDKHVAIYGLRFSPDGKVLAAARSDGSVVLWDVVPAGKQK